MFSSFSKRKLIDKILIVSGSMVFIMLIFYLFITYRAPRQYLLKPGFSGWVTVKYEKPHAGNMNREGKNRVFEVPDNGMLETNERFDFGWGKDDFFWLKDGKREPIPAVISSDEGMRSWVHHKMADYAKLDCLLTQVGRYSDTLLFDGSKVERQGDTVNVTHGRKVLQHFFISSKPEKIGFQPPPLPEERKWW